MISTRSPEVPTIGGALSTDQNREDGIAAQHIGGARRKFGGDRAGFIGFLLGLLSLSFLSGIVITVMELPPSALVRDAALAAQALLDRQDMRAAEFPDWLWSPAIRSGQGLVRHDRAQAFPGFTLYVSGHGGVAVLLDMDGNEVHRWEAPFSKVWPRAEHVSGSTPDSAIYIRRAHVFPNGDLLALYETPLDTPFGYGLAKLDADGRVIWTYDANAHHDFSVAEDGTIYVLTQSIRTTPVPGWKELHPPMLEEFVVILSPDGRERKRISLFDAIVGTPFLRAKTVGVSGDVLHSNTVHVINESFAARHGISAGGLMVCLRHLDLVAVIDPDVGKIVWATTGPWHFPHDPDPLHNGRILIFDNVYARGSTGGSRVIEFDPADGTVHWAYAGTEREPFQSDIRACSQLLPNGNVLIAESDYGRLLEVTHEGQIVWEYVNPVRGGQNGELVPIVCGVRRYKVEQLPFLADQRSKSDL